MRGIGVLEDGFVFTEDELERGTPRFWWGPRKRAAFDHALARRGLTRKKQDEETESSSSDDTGDDASSSVLVAGASAEMVLETAEKKTETGGSWFGSWGGARSDGGGSSDSGGSSGSDSGGSSDGGSSSSE